MGIGEFFAKINSFFEDKYYAFSDFLTEKGIPIDKYNDFLESKGIPPVWFNIILLIILIAVIVLIVFMVSKVNVNLYVSIVDSEGNSLPSADLILKSGEITLFEQVVNPGKYTFNTKNGASLSVNAIISGYTFLGPGTIIIEGKDLDLKLKFLKNELLGNMNLRLVDNIEKTILAGAKVSLFDGDKLLFEGTSNDKGEISLLNVPISEPLKLKVFLDGYLDTEKTIYARDGILENVEIERKAFNSTEYGTLNFSVKSLGQGIKDAKIEIYNAKTNTKIDEVYTDSTGAGLLNAPKGTVVRYLVSKENFVTYNSQENNQNITIIQNSIPVNIELLVGGINLEVFVKNESLKELSNVLVALYSENGLLLDVNRTGILGSVIFSGLDVKRGAYISAYTEDNYYPATKKIVNVNVGKEEIILKQMNAQTNANVNLFTIDSKDSPISASLQLFYFENNDYQPIILPDSKTSVAGFFSVILEANKTIYVEAQNNDLYGTIEETLGLGQNDFDIVMLPNKGNSKLYVYGLDGKVLKNAELKISSETQVLYDGNTLDGIVEFYPYDLKEVEVSVYFENNYYSKILFVEPKMEFTLNALDISTNPRISFMGIYDAFGKKINGVKAGETYNLKFNVVWPKDQKTGELHIRLGEGYAPTNGYGIYGASAYGASTEYGLYFSKNESVSNVKDLQVFGRPGIKNNWVNIYYENPKGSNEINVKIKIDASLSVDKIPLDYRAISFDGIYHADPNTEISTNKLERLYATTKQETLQVFLDTFECSEIANLCYSYKFVDEFGKIENFEAALDQQYALDLEFYSINDVATQIKFSSKNVLNNLTLNNISSNLDEFLPEENSQEELVLDLVLAKGQTIKYRLYFTPKALGVGKVNMLISQMNIDRDFSFTIKEKSNMQVTLNNTIFDLGSPIAFKVSSTSGNITNAKITIYDSENLVNVLILGDNTVSNGLNGEYIVKELPAGNYTYSVSAKNYSSVSGKFIVTRLNILSLKKQYDIRIPKGMTQIDYELEIKNISKLPVTNLGVEILNDSAEMFTIQYRFNKNNLAPGQNAILVVTVFYENEDIVFGSQNIAITGLINTNETVRALTNLTISANKNLDDSCLEITPAEATVTLYDVSSEKYNGEFVLKNNCEYDFPNLSINLVSKSTEDLEALLNFTTTTASLSKGESKSIKYNLTSNQKLTTAGLNLEAAVLFDVGYLQKEIPLSIKLVNSDTTFVMALQQQQMYMISGQQSIQLLLLKNMGNAPIKNIKISYQPYSASGAYGMDSLLNLSNSIGNTSAYGALGSATDYLTNLNSYSNNVQIASNPNVVSQLLPGQTTMVQLFVNAQFSRTSNNVSAFMVTATGSNAIDNQQVSQTVPLLVNLSTQDCFKLNVPLNKISFLSNKLNVNLENTSATIKNECIEPIVLNLPFSEVIQGNSLEITSESEVVAPMQSVKLKSVFNTANKMSLTKPIVFEAVGQYTRAKYKLTINYDFDIGESNIGKAKSPTIQKEYSYCDGSGNVKVTIPKIAKSVSCSEAYCDGQLATEFISGKVKAFYDNYSSQVLKYSKNLNLTSCNPDSQTCGFDYIGVSTNQFTLFLMHDVVSNEYLEELITKNINAIRGVELASDKDLDLSKYELSFNRVYIDPELTGCGKYVIDLKGSFLIRDSIPQTDSINIFVDVIEKESMSECEEKQENFIMYLPKDIIQKTDSLYGFNYAVLDSETGLKEFAKEVSKSIFGSERLDSSRRYNTLHISQKEIGLSQLTVGVKDAVVNVALNKNFDMSRLTDKQDALRLIKALWEGNLGGCINKQTGEFEATHLEDASTGKYAVTNCGPIYLGLGLQECNFTTDGAKLGSGDLTISGPNQGYTARIKDKQGNSVSNVSFIDGLKKEFILEINFTDVDLAQANLKQNPMKIVLTSYGTEVTGNVDFKKCGVLPQEFISSSLNSELKNKYYSAQIDLGNAKSIEACKVFEEVQKSNKGLFLTAKTSNDFCSTNNVDTVKTIISNNFTKVTVISAVTAFGACTLTELGLKGVGKLLLGGPLGLATIPVECGITTGFLAGMSIYSNWDNFGTSASQDDPTSTLTDVITGATGGALGGTIMGTKGALAAPAFVSETTAFNDALVNATRTYGGSIGTFDDELKFFQALANKDPEFAKQFSSYNALAKKKGMSVTNFYKQNLSGLGPKFTQDFDELFKAAKTLTALDTEITDLTKRLDDLKQVDDATKSQIDDLTKKLDELKLKRANVVTELDQFGRQLSPTSRLQRFRTMMGSKGWTFARGLARGLISGAVAGLAYDWKYLDSFKNIFNKESKSIDLILPDVFVDNTSYTLELDEVEKGKYVGIVKEDKSVSGFCVKENIDKKYLAKDFLVPYSSTTTGATETSGATSTSDTSRIPGQCSSYSDLLNKYGEILKQKTQGKMDGKNIIAQYGNESAFDPVVVSVTGALGLGQFIQSTYCGFTKDLASGKYSEFTKDFDLTRLNKFGASNWQDLYNITCNPVKTQCPGEGGILVPPATYNKTTKLKTVCKGTISYKYKEDSKFFDITKDPRSDPEIAILYTTILLYNNYNSKKSVRAAVESYVVGPGCITGEGQYSSRIDCADNFAVNPGIKSGSYWSKYQNTLNSAGTCLASAPTFNTTQALGEFCNSNAKIALVGDSITVGWGKDLLSKINSCGAKVTKISSTQYPNCDSDSLACGSAPTNWMLSQLQGKYAAGEKYDLVFVMGGANDGGNYAKTTTNLSAIYSLAKSNGAKVVAMSIVPGPNDDFRKRVNDWIASNSGMVDSYINNHDTILASIYNGNAPADAHNSRVYDYISNEVKQSYFS